MYKNNSTTILQVKILFLGPIETQTQSKEQTQRLMPNVFQHSTLLPYTLRFRSINYS